MKKTLLLSLIAFCGATQAFADKTVYVNGNKVDTDVESITFKGDNLSLVTPSSSTSNYDIEEVEIDFDDAEGVENTSSTLLSFNSEVSESLDLTGVEPGTALQIIAADGKVVYTGTATGSEVTISTSQLAAAPYVLKVGNQTYKFIKK